MAEGREEREREKVSFVLQRPLPFSQDELELSCTAHATLQNQRKRKADSQEVQMAHPSAPPLCSDPSEI